MDDSATTYYQINDLYAELTREMTLKYVVIDKVMHDIKYLLDFNDLFDVNYVPDEEYDYSLLEGLQKSASPGNVCYISRIAGLLFNWGFSTVKASSIMDALKMNDLPTLQIIIDFQPKWLTEPLYETIGNSLMMEAVRLNRPLIVEYLLTKNISLCEVPNKYGHLPFLLAAELGYWDCMDAMLRAFKGNEQRLVSQKHKQTTKNVLHILAKVPQSTSIARSLVQLGADPKALDSKGRTPSLIAFFHSNDYFEKQIQ